MRVEETAFNRVRYGYRRILILLRREGFHDSHKRVYRVYRQEGLKLRMKRPRRSRMAAQRLERVDIGGVHPVWSMDFVADQLFNGNRFQILNVVNNDSKKCPGLFVDRQIKGADIYP
ncbi:MAG: IS3 family transposase [Chlorobaculum sp.]